MLENMGVHLFISTLKFLMPVCEEEDVFYSILREVVPWNSFLLAEVTVTCLVLAFQLK